MNPHVSEWLAAYHDGELSSNRRRQVDKHLQDCLTCRAELEAYGELSALLKVDPVPTLPPAERFAAQVRLRLPRVSPPRTRQNGGRSSRWALGVALTLMIVWAFLQGALRVTSVILTADNLRGAPDGPAAPFNSWITTQGLVETTANLLFLDTILLIGTIIFWSAWVAFWLASEKNEMNYLQKEV